jgi:hypothetical protein
MVQYFSQEQCSSAFSHMAQTTGPGIGKPPRKTVPEPRTCGKARDGSRRELFTGWFSQQNAVFWVERTLL